MFKGDPGVRGPFMGKTVSQDKTAFRKSATGLRLGKNFANATAPFENLFHGGSYGDRRLICVWSSIIVISLHQPLRLRIFMSFSGLTQTVRSHEIFSLGREEVLLEKVVKCLRLQNSGTGQVQGTMFGKEQGVGPLLAARPGQVLGLLQTCGKGSRTFPMMSHSLALCG